MTIVSSAPKMHLGVRSKENFVNYILVSRVDMLRNLAVIKSGNGKMGNEHTFGKANAANDEQVRYWRPK